MDLMKELHKPFVLEMIKENIQQTETLPVSLVMITAEKLKQNITVIKA